MAVARLLLVALVALTAVYVSLSLYSRARARDRLEAEWDEGGRPGPREAYVRRGLADSEGARRRKLVLGVYVAPLALACLAVYLVNFA